ncbi:MAG: response regulator, partial [Phycisphaeraceae bacterium]|nr:response regulator [Phycisphaeraceae bacterium]
MTAENKQKVLLAEDDRTTRDWMAEALRAGGYEVLEAADGFEAIDRLQTNDPSVVLLDVNMPGMDGLAFLDRLRRMPRCKDLPVIMVTASEKNEQVLRAANLGIDGYL